MKKSTNSNMYTVSYEYVMETYGSFLKGNPETTVGVVSERTLSPEAQTALQKALGAIGYPSEGIMYITLTGDKDEETLPDEDLLSIVEGLDPLCLIITDEKAATSCAQAYKAKLPFYERASLLTRPVVAFQDFEAMFRDEKEKHRAWSILKRLPKADAS